MREGVSIQYPVTALHLVDQNLLKDPERLLSLNEVARVLRVKDSWCYNDRSLPWLKIGKYKKLYAKDLSAYLLALHNAARENVMRHSRAQEIVEKLEVMD